MKVGNQGKQTHHPVVHNLLRGAGAIAGFLAGGPGAASAGFKIGDKVGGLIDCGGERIAVMCPCGIYTSAAAICRFILKSCSRAIFK